MFFRTDLARQSRGRAKVLRSSIAQSSPPFFIPPNGEGTASVFAGHDFKTGYGMRPMNAHSVKSAILRTYRWLKHRKLTRNPAILRALSGSLRLNLAAFEASASGGIVVTRSNVDPCAKDRRFSLRGSDSMAGFLAWAQARFSGLPDGALLEVGGISLKPQSSEELLIASEVFAERIKNFSETPRLLWSTSG